ncbi:hypothetical protein DdX_13158 [Ditylenchus destructor]|uniref:N-acetyltransferase domain-containing protein n=1 Tax=Ditylenchus destructor TaxID=166010 RepID=A0AAD4R301_9BILA|nr:hypothetical protein DdX_13158 [Ditylenchus destructor]
MEFSTRSKNTFKKRDRADWLPLNILENHIEDRKRKDPSSQGDKPKPGSSHGSGNPGCTGRNCEKSSKPCTAYKNVDKEKPTQSNAGKLTRNIPRFTRVARIHTWRAGRPRETRPPRFAQCTMKRCSTHRQCQRISAGHRLKRTPNQCRFCGYNLAWNKKTCGHFKEGSDRWIPNILIEENDGAGVLRIPDFTEEPEPAGQLHYERDQDPNGRKFMRFNYIEVKERYQNRSMGKALVKSFIENVVMKNHRDLNLVKLEVGDHERNAKAKRLYERFGFSRDQFEGNPWEYHMNLDVRRYQPAPQVSVPRDKKL